MKRSEELQQELQALSAEREAALAGFKERGLKLTKEYETAVADESVAEKVAGMSDEEKAALQKQLNQSIAPDGVDSTEEVGEVA